MRTIVLVLLLAFTMIITGCGAQGPPESASENCSESTSEEQIQDTASMTAETDSSSETADNNNSEIASDGQASSEASGTDLPSMDTEPGRSSTPPAPSTPENPPVVSEQPTPSLSPEPEPAESDLPSESVQPIEPNAGAEDTQAVAEKVLAYINQYRAEQGGTAAVKLPGLTEYAEYRSRQLVSNFAHDTDDERAAATALRYGQYIDPAVYGMTGEPYYTVNAREAIAMGGYSGTINEVAKSLAMLVRNSPGHWSYVGSTEYGYIAVGVTYRSGMWYCDIASVRENTDEN